MKKFVIIALIFALAAGAAFAQDGSWSVSGEGEIGFMLNFAGDKTFKSQIQAEKDGVGETPTPYYVLKDNAKLYPLVGASGYNNIGWYGGILGNLGVNYSRGGLKAGLSFTGEKGGTSIGGNMQYGDDTRAFQFEQNLKTLFMDGSFDPSRLWGWYKFLDGVIHLEAAVNSRDNNWWYSSGVVRDLFSRDGDAKVITIEWNDNLWNPGQGYTKVDHHNFLLVELAPIDGLKLGFQIPSVFVFGGGSGDNTDAGKWQTAGSAGSGGPGYVAAQGNNHIAFVDDALLKTRIGAQFATGPINIAAQFALLGKVTKNKIETAPTVTDAAGKEYNLTVVKPEVLKEEIDGVEFTEDVQTIGTGVYLGATIGINDNLGAGLAFQGEFDENKRPKLAFGANVNFNSGPLGAGLAVGLSTIIDPTETLYYPTKKGSPYVETVGIQNKTYSGIYLFADDIDTDNSNSILKKATESILAVSPSVSFAVVENYLTASLDSLFYWKLGTEDNTNMISERKYQESVFGYEITPQLWFNVTGTGTGKGYYSGTVNNGIIVRYKIAGWVDGSEVRELKKVHQVYADANSIAFNRPIYNALDITFRWGF